MNGKSISITSHKTKLSAPDTETEDRRPESSPVLPANPWSQLHWSSRIAMNIWKAKVLTEVPFGHVIIVSGKVKPHPNK